MTNKTFDTLKLIALLSPIIVFASAVINIWGIPYGDQIILTLSALETMLSAFVVVINENYKRSLEA